MGMLIKGSWPGEEALLLRGLLQGLAQVSAPGEGSQVSAPGEGSPGGLGQRSSPGGVRGVMVVVSVTPGPTADPSSRSLD